MKPGTFFLVAIALILSPFPALADDGSYSHITAVLGHKTFDMEYWEPAQDQGGFSIEYDYAKNDWPVSLMIGISYGDDESEAGENGEISKWGSEGTIIKTASTELYGGARKYFRRGKTFVPYIGAGVSVISMDVAVDSGDGEKSPKRSLSRRIL